MWGLTNFPIYYDPPIKEASGLQAVRQEKADGPDLDACWIQKDPRANLSTWKEFPSLMCLRRQAITARTPTASPSG
jgi:hypothetical protein